MLDASLIYDGTVSSAGVATGAALTTTRASTNVLDLLVARDLGAGSVLGTQVTVMTALTGATSLQVGFEVSADNSTFYNIQLSPVIPVAQLIAGAPIFRYSVPLNQVLNATAGIPAAPGRYVRLYYTIVGTFGAGTIFASMIPVNDRVQTYTYPKNYVG